MSRQLKQSLAREARKVANTDSFVSILLLSDENVEECRDEIFVQILSNINDLCQNKSLEERSIYIQKTFERMLKMLSRKILISFDKITNVIKEYIQSYPSMSILTLDELKTIGLVMEKRSIIIHFDMSASMNVSGFSSLVKKITELCQKFQSEGNNVFISLFGGEQQENVHRNRQNQLLTLEDFLKGNFQANGSHTNFCPSFERTKNIHFGYDSIIISDGEFTDNVSQLTFQTQCKTVYFIAPPWSPKGVEEKHAKSISSSVHSNVPYIGIDSQRYSQLDTILQQYFIQHNSFVHLNGYTSIGSYFIPEFILSPTEFIQMFNHSIDQGEQILELIIKKLIGLFRYVEETAKLDFQRCLTSHEFQSLMSLIIPLTKISFNYLEKSLSSQHLYGYLTNLLNYFTNQKQILIQKLNNDKNTIDQINKYWQNAMTFNEKLLIIENNNNKYGLPIAYLNLSVETFNCTNEILCQAFQQLRTIYVPDNYDSLSLILDILSSAKLDQQPIHLPQDLQIPVWRKSDGNIDLLSILRLFPLCLQQYQLRHNYSLDNQWTLQPLAATRLSWVMEASRRTFPEFINSALSSLILPNSYLTDINNDENRSTFWLKILRQLSSKIDLSQETIQSINQILTVHVLKRFLNDLTDSSVSYDKPIYENVSPFIDTDKASAWTIFIDEKGNRVDASTGQIIQTISIVTDPIAIARYYDQNVYMHGSIVRPRYLTLLEYPQLPNGAIQLYQASAKKDSDILRDQLTQLNNPSYSLDQINAHIYTIRDKFKSIPSVLWNSEEQIRSTVTMVKDACKDASIPTEKVVINIPRTHMIDYLISHCQDTFISGASKGFIEYNRISKEEHSSGLTEFDYVIQSGLNTTTVPSFDTIRFIHFDKPGVKQYFEKYQKKLKRSLESINNPPQFTSLSTLIQQIQKTNNSESEILGMNHLEAIPLQSTTTTSTLNSSQVSLTKDFFTCPITVDIMDNPATTTPCGHMFEMDAIQSYLNTVDNKCPICRTIVTAVTLNYNFKNVIQAWMQLQTQ